MWNRLGAGSTATHLAVLLAAGGAVAAAALTGGSRSLFFPFLFLPVILAVVGCRFPFTFSVGVALAAAAIWIDGKVIPVPADVSRGLPLLGITLCGGIYMRAVIRERETMLAALKQKESLLDASRIIFASDDLETAVDSALQLLPTLVPAFRCAAIFLDNDNDGSMSLYDVIGLERGDLLFDRFDPNAPDARWRPTDPAPLYVKDVNSLPSAAIALLDPKARAVLCLSVQSPRAFTSSVGMLYVSSGRANAFSNEQIGALQEFADLIGFPLQKARVQEGLQNLAFSDPMTGLANYRYFRVELEEEVKRGSRYRHSVSLIMLDLDHFKSVNDRFGHQVGDSALRWVADIIRASIRDADFPARYGGEEFAIVCGETGLEEAVVIANRIRASVESQPFHPDSADPISLTVSAGVASFPASGSSDSDLIRAADSALYEAKRAGRNRVSIQPIPESKRRTA